MKTYLVKLFLLLAFFLQENPLGASSLSAATSPADVGAIPPRYALYDTIEVLHNTLRLDLSQIGEAILRGRAEITVRSKQDKLAFAPFLLLGMQIDSVQVNGRHVGGYQYNDTLLRVPLGRPLPKGGEARLTILYHGRPIHTRFGGFIFTDSLRHASNMGVSIDDIPHSFGRSWFPAVDDFRSRSTFDLYLRADTALTAVASGILQSVRPGGGGNDKAGGGNKSRRGDKSRHGDKSRKNDESEAGDKARGGDGTAVWHWQQRQPIPDYLVSVAVGPYEKISYPYTSLGGRPLPVDVYVFPDEAEAARETYAILPQALGLLENYFGPYAFDRVGYVSVDRRGGAMEHVANISMPRHPRPTVNYRTVAIHELIHSWFGNRVTCRTAHDMFLNEGITNFAPELVLEKLYGPGEAARYVRQNQWSALLLAPAMEKGYLPLCHLPEEHTYGITVYDKGAMVMHTLRYYLGDEKLLPALKAYVEAYAFRTASVADFQAFISRHTATDLTDFFDLWVNQPGFVAFEIDSVRGRDVAGGFRGTVYLEQKRCHAPAYGRRVRVPLTFYDASGRRSEQREVVADGAHTAAAVTLPFRPAFGLVDPGYALCKASLYDMLRADTAGVYPSRLCRMEVEAASALPLGLRDSSALIAVSASPGPSASVVASASPGSSASLPFDPVSLHLEYYRVSPDPIRDKEMSAAYRLCDTHYWRVSGVVPSTVRLAGRFPVATEGPEAAWLGEETAAVCPEDETAPTRPGIRLMYRRDAADDWKPVARLPRTEASGEDSAATAPAATTPARAAANRKPEATAAGKAKSRKTAEREIVAPLLPGEYCLGAGK